MPDQTTQRNDVTQPTVSADALQVLESMADVLTRFAQQYEVFASETKWRPTADSPLAIESEQLLNKMGPGGAWDGTELQHAVSSAAVFLLVQQQHLQALAALFRDQLILYSLAPLSRSMHELSGRVAWLLDPRVGTRQRAARGLLGEIEDATRAKRAAYSLRFSQASKYGQRLHEVRKARLRSRFYDSEVRRTKSGALILCGQVLPGLREGLAIREQISESDWNSGGLYDYLSNASHPTLHTAMEMLGENPQPMGDDAPQMTLRLTSMTYPYRLGRNSALAFLETWALYAAYLGLDFTVPQQLGHELDDVPEP